MNYKRQNYSGTEVRLREMDTFSISMSSHQPGTKVRTHFHEKPYLCLLINGTYSERGHRTSSIIETGTSIFRAAEYEHANQFYDAGGMCFNIEINNSEEFMDENDFRIPSNEFARCGNINIYRLLHLLNSDTPEDQLNILCYESFFGHFDMIPVRGKLDWIRRVKERILGDPCSSISLTRLSKEFGLHPNYIVRKFKEVTGYRLSEYLNKIRIEMALGKMLKTEETLTKIALDSGFCDQSHFNRNFNRHISSSPKIFRKTLKRLV